MEASLSTTAVGTFATISAEPGRASGKFAGPACNAFANEGIEGPPWPREGVGALAELGSGTTGVEIAAGLTAVGVTIVAFPAGDASRPTAGTIWLAVEASCKVPSGRGGAAFPTFPRTSAGRVGRGSGELIRNADAVRDWLTNETIKPAGELGTREPFALDFPSPPTEAELPAGSRCWKPACKTKACPIGEVRGPATRIPREAASAVGEGRFGTKGAGGFTAEIVEAGVACGSGLEADVAETCTGATGSTR